MDRDSDAGMGHLFPVDAVLGVAGDVAERDTSLRKWWLLYVLGAGLLNGMLTLEFVRKTQLEADQIAARQIQQMLIPLKLPGLPGYEVETFYKPFREVGGDYFDVVELPNNRTLFAVADVSGKGMPAALLAANYRLWLEASRVLRRIPWRWLGGLTST
jgi:sigma-B regulation protein RsbU (phosphoserine phosphatase)